MSTVEIYLGYSFDNPELLNQALTHPSFSAEQKSESPDNQRLEFLGDAVIELAITEALYGKFPEAGEGALTKWRARLVSKKALAELGLKIKIDEEVRLGRGEIAHGGQRRDSTLADCVEAIFGAVYLDSSFSKAQKVVLELFAASIEAVTTDEETGNPKGELQEVLQALAPYNPTYRIEAEDGPDHRKKFAAVVSWNGRELGKGQGASKKAAESNAAATALQNRCWEKLK